MKEKVVASFPQTRLWFLEHLFQLQDLYHFPMVYELNGNLQVSYLNNALLQIINRHEILRTAIELQEDEPVQMVYSKIEFSLQEINLISESHDRSVLMELINSEISKPFALETPPLMRATLIKLTESNFILVIALHHIIFDGWSKNIFIEELNHFYNSQFKTIPELAELQFQYADYSLWQHEFIAADISKSKLSYWQDLLKKFPASTLLPIDKNRPETLSFKGDFYRFKIDSIQLNRLSQLANSNGVTLNVLLLTIFQTLLHRYSGDEKIIIGVPFANRTQQEFGNIIGFFVNMIPIFTELQPNLNFIELLQQTKNNFTNTLEYADIPFEKLVEKSQSTRNLSLNPIFQVMFVYQNSDETSLNFDAIEAKTLDINRKVSRFDLSLSAQLTKSQLMLGLEYSSDLFTEDTIVQMAKNFVNLIDEIINNPQGNIAQLTCLSEEDSQKIQHWNQTETVYPFQKCLHHLIEEQVSKTPKQIALRYHQQSLSYLELNKKVNRLAHFLIDQQVKVGDVVGVCLERSCELVIAILAVLKAGGAYMPLDSSYPQQRLAYMVKDSQIKILISSTHLKKLFDPFNGALIDLEEIQPQLSQSKSTNPNVKMNGSSPIYVIYTSGSTGNPKGVINRHESLVNRLLWMQEQYSCSKKDRVLHKTPFSFDVSVWELFLPLISGSKLIIAAPNIHKEPLEIAKLIFKEKVTIVHFVPSMLQAFLRENLAQWCHSLQQVFVSGEALTPEIQQNFFKEFNCELHNLYGPTEAAIDVTFWKCDPGYSAIRVPIGKPIANMKTYILNERMQMTGIGIPGELYLGGIGVASGYLNQEELTQNRFLLDTFSSSSLFPLYKTGDRACWLSDGNIEYIGRIDKQVKLRGFRIELEEIEACILKSKLVNEVVVDIYRHQTEEFLVAYLILPETSSLDDIVNDLKQKLAIFLPEFMIPAFFLRLETLPLMENGKLNRNLLPQIKFETLSQNQFVTANTEIEKRLENIWLSLLPIDKISIHDNFFNLGGHSLLAVRLAGKINQQFHCEISLKLIFENPTIAGLCKKISFLQRKDSRMLLIPPRDKNTNTLLTFAQQRLWFLEHLIPNSTLYNVPIIFELEGPLNKKAIRAAANALLARHEALRIEFKQTSSGIIQQVIPKLTLSIGIKNSIAESVNHTFDLSRAPLIKIDLIIINKLKHILVILIHHIIIDEWSVGILCRDFSILYNASISHSQPLLPDLKIQFLDFAEWQRRFFAEQLQPQLHYWKTLLQTAPESLSLHTDLPRPTELTYQGQKYEFSIDDRLYQSLKEFIQQHECSLFMFLMAAFQVLLYRYTLQEHIVVGAPIANRKFADLNDVIGCFVNILPIYAKFDEDLTFDEFLRQIKSVCLDAYQNQDLPFEQLLNELEITRNLNRNPLFQTFFVLNNPESQLLSFANIKAAPLKFENSLVKFELGLSASPKPNSLEFTFDFMTDLFSLESIKLMGDHFVNLLTQIIYNSSEKITKLDLVSVTEREKLLFEFSGSYFELPGQTLTQILSQSLIENSQSVALKYLNQSISYEQLNTRSNQLADFLIQNGCSPGSFIGLCLSRSPDLIIAILAILKTGAAYVPLDPELPEQRLQFMCADCDIHLIITHTQFSSISLHYPSKVIYLDQLQDQIIHCSPELPKVKTSPDDIIYVIYTSGSTGKPKGVANIHKALVNRILWMQAQYQVNSDDVILHKTPYSFDVSGWEFFLPLISGSCLVIAPPLAHKDPLELIQLIQLYKVTIIHFVPSMLETFLNFPPPTNCSLRAVFTSGEALSSELAANFRKIYRCDLHNLYGPTEAAIDVSYWQYRDNWPGALIPIGKPICNTEIYILNKTMQLAGIGIPGELHIGGVGLAKGYINREALTQEKFIANPFKQDQSRLYKSGDLARYLPSGEILFHGRLDSQIKLKGFRIEIGEIESILRKHPAVSLAVVVVREDIKGLKQLVAYIVSIYQQVDSNQHLTTELMESLTKQLPAFMLPSVIIYIDKLPMLPSGKIDYKNLPAVSYADADEKIPTQTIPANETEIILMSIYSNLLNIKTIRTKDSFFKLGGDSILSIQLVVAARQQGLVFSVKDVFLNPTVAQLAKVAKQSAGLNSLRKKFSSYGSTRLSAIQNWFFHCQLKNDNYFNQSRIWRISTLISFEMFTNIIAQLVKRHDVLRLKFIKGPAETTGFYSDTIEVEKCLTEENIETEQFDLKLTEIAQEYQRKINIYDGPIFRAVLLNNKPSNQQYILLIMHHLIIDNVSWRILSDEISALLHNSQTTLPDLSFSYQDWVESQWHLINQDQVRSEISFWQEVINRPTTSLSCKQPLLDHYPIKTRFNFTINQELTQQISTIVTKSFNLTINEILLTALILAVGEITHNYALTLELEGHGRDSYDKNLDTHSIIGWFTTIFPINFNVNGFEKDFSKIFQVVKLNLRSIPNKGNGYGLLRYLANLQNLKPKLCQFRFNYLGQLDLPNHIDNIMVYEGSAGETSDPLNTFSLIEMNCFILKEQLKIILNFDASIFADELIQSLQNQFCQKLKAIADYCQIHQFKNYTIYDFPQSKLSQDELDKVFDDIPEINAIFSLSPMQKGILYHTIKYPNSSAYLTQHLIELGGDIETNLLSQAWTIILNRHPSLKTGFAWQNLTEPKQFVLNHLDLPIIYQNIELLPTDQQNQLIEKTASQDRNVPFNLLNPPLIRMQCFITGSKTAILIWTMHHILVDGWCIPLLLQQFLQVYKQLKFSLDCSSLTEEAASYYSYIEWLENKSVHESELYWTNYFKDFTEPTFLANSIENSSGSIQEYCYHELMLSEHLTQELVSICKQLELTPNTIFQALWGYLLSLYTQKTDIVFGITISGRAIDLEDVDSTVGLFINTLPMRMLLDRVMLIEFLKLNQLRLVEMSEHGNISLAVIKRNIKMSAIQELFDTLFVFENYPVDHNALNNDTTLRIVRCKGREETEYPLTIAIIPGKQYKIRFSYQSKVFNTENIHQLSVHYHHLLSQMTSAQFAGNLTDYTLQPYEPIDVDHSCYRYSLEKPAHFIFREQVQRFPNNPAIIENKTIFTYAQLEQKSNILATKLIEKGINPEEIVAVLLPRSALLVISMLAIWKIGAVYMPLDSDYPAERLQFMLEDSCCETVIFSNQYNHLAGLDAEFIDIDQLDWQRFDTESEIPVIIAVHQPAYLNYTSGTTGKPKGVVNTHIGLVNRLLWSRQAYAFSSQDRLLQIAATGFDISIWEMMMPLISGGVLIVAKPEGQKDIAYLCQVLFDYQITFLHIVPSLLNLLLDYPLLSNCKSLQRVLTGGEAVSFELRQRFTTILNCQLFVAYGPTEASISVTHYDCNEEPELNKVIIGRAITHARIYILNDYLQALPQGLTGELYIAGVCLANGYINQPELTHKKFITDPFVQDGSLMYRTGDLARYLPNGLIEFLGRKDQQIKINGNRIELHEIEHVLNAHPIVKNSVVVAETDKNQRHFLIAYIVAYNDKISDSEFDTIKKFIGTKLPSYMQPRYFISIDQIPLTVNGKIDFSTLKNFQPKIREENSGGAPPQTRLEEILIAIWLKVLPNLQQKIGVNDNFFSLGGDSISSIQMLSLARQQGLQFEISDIFKFPTIRSLAKNMVLPNFTVPVMKKTAPINSLFELSPIQQRFFTHNPQTINRFNQSQILKISTDISEKKLTEILQILIDHHEVFKIAFCMQQNGWRQKFKSAISIQDYLSHWNSDSSEIKPFLTQVVNSLHERISIKADMLFQIAIVDEVAEKYLIIVMHHLIVDIISWNIIYDDFNLLLMQAANKEILQLHNPNNTYFEWIENLKKMAESPDILADLNYWRLIGSSIKNDKVHPQGKAVVQHGLLSEASSKYITLAKQNGYRLTTEQILLLIFAVSYSEWSNTATVCFNIEKHGRDLKNMDLSGVVGWLTNVFPLHLTVDHNQNFDRLIKNLKSSLNSIPNNGISYSLLKYLHPERPLADLDESRLAFNYLGKTYKNNCAGNKLCEVMLELFGNGVGADLKLEFDLYFETRIIDDQVHFYIRYNDQQFQYDQIQKLQSQLRIHADNLINYLSEPSHYGYTNTDFPLAKLTQEQIDFCFSKKSNIEDVYPLGPMQAGLLFSSLYNPSSNAYFVQTSMELTGHLHLELLQNAWQKIINYYSILRTGFLWNNLDKPIQYVVKEVTLPWQFIDWSNLNKQSLAENLNKLIANDQQTHFDFQHPPLIRLTCIKISEKQHYLLLSQHHILLDGWSLPLIIQDVFQLYQALVSNDRFEFANPAEYRPYVEWLQHFDHKTAQDFWRRTLSSLEMATLLKVVKNTENIKQYDSVELSFSDSESELLRHCAANLSCTLSSLFQAAWSLLLSRYTNQTQVAFGVTISGRSISVPNIQNLVGLFINTLPLIVSLDSSITFAELVNQVQNNMALLQQYGYLSLAEIQSYSRCGVQTALFNHILVFENFDAPQVGNKTYADLRLTNLPMSVQTEYPLTIAIIPHTIIRIQFNFQTQFFDTGAVHRLFMHLKNILLQLTENPAINHKDVILVSQNEQQQLLNDFNKTKRDNDNDALLLRQFKSMVLKNPAIIALQEPHRTKTYLELDQDSDKVAFYIKSLNFSPNSLIAVALPRSIEAVIAILAIFKLGHAYLPLDLNNPDVRLEYILSEAKPKLILTDQKSKSRFNQNHHIILTVEKASSFPLNQSLPPSYHQPDDLVYVIFTSGSTGKPKGVMIKYQGLSNYLNWAMKTYPTFSANGSILHTSLAFDMMVTCLFVPLLTGKTLFIVPEQFVATALIEALRLFNGCFNFIKLTPSHWRMLNQHFSKKEILAKSRAYIIGGEQLLNQDVQTYYDCLDQIDIYNEYGPTEATVACAAYRLQASLHVQEEIIPIGRPFDNCRLYILDNQLNPVPLGVAGELYIAGQCLAQGYIGESEKDASRFFEHRFKILTETERLYRTGDLVRYLVDGNLQFLQRLDNQVKFHGYRIDLLEVEKYLLQHEDLAAAVVEIYQEDQLESLIAYVTFKEFKPSEKEIKNFLSKTVPDYMIPNMILILDRFPLNENGKVNKQELRKLIQARSDGDSFTPVTTITELKLAELWTDLLHVEKIGLNSDFFALGGHSLLATQLMSRIRRDFNIQIPLRDIFSYSTLSKLADLIDRQLKSTVTYSENLLIKPIDVIAKIPLSFAQQRLWILEQLLNNPGLYNVSIGFELKGTLSLNYLQQALISLIERHEILRTTFHATKDQPIQIVHPIEPEKILKDGFEFHDCSAMHDQSQFVNQCLKSELTRAFDLATGPLMLIKILKLNHTRHVLIITLHHIITDGWSMPILIKELSAYYNHYRNNSTPALELLSVQYKDFAVWQRQWFTGEIFQKQLQYWMNQLENADFVINFPTSRPRPKVVSYQGAFYHRILDQILLDQLKQYCQDNSLTLFMPLIVCFYLLLSNYSRQQDIIIGTPIANRNHHEIESLIGFFVNTLLIRLQSNGNCTFAQLMETAKNVILSAYQNQDLPYEQLVEHLKTERQIDKNSLFQVMFILQNAGVSSLDLNGITQVKSISSKYPFSRFDLCLVAEEGVDGLKLSFNYATALFDVDFIADMAEVFENILKQIVGNPDLNLSDISLLNPQQQRHLSALSFGNHQDFGIDKTISQLFEEQAAQIPLALAISDGKCSLTYHELNARANHLAWSLISAGIQPGEKIGLIIRRDVDLLSVILAVLKVGCAYVPLDPLTPLERIRYIINDCQITKILISSGFETNFRILQEKFIMIDELFAQTFISKNNPQLIVNLNQPAYVLYTSGSTGVPKGVIISHTSIINCLLGCGQYLESNSAERFLALAAYTFDISVFDFLMPLFCGAHIIIADDESRKLPEKIIDLIDTYQISCINITPTMLQLLCDAGWQTKGPIKIVSGGENLSDKLAQELLKRGRLFNFYGPTETTIYCSAIEIKADFDTITIGKPLANTSAFVLNEHQQMLPIGVYGEIYLGGLGVAIGYLNRQELNEEKFITIPDLDKNNKFYRSGDLGRYLADGTIQFLSRIDDQVKINGIRIELGEIESTLLRHPWVEHAIARVWQEPNELKFFLAYVVGKQSLAKEQILVLEEYLANQLPGYMLPHLIIPLEKIPLNSSGKIDRKQLPKPIFIQSTDDVERPVSVEERSMHQIWQQLLGHAEFGVDDNFFQIGGNSLLIIKLHQLITQEYKLRISIIDLFQYPTIKKLLQFIQQGSAIHPIVQNELKAINKNKFLKQRRRQKQFESILNE